MSASIRIPADELAVHLTAALEAAGASAESGAAAVRAMMHASRVGVDSHGARLIGYYDEMLRMGAFNRTPELTVRRTAAATAVVDADDGLGHFAAYRAIDEAVALARESGIGAVGVVRTSHFGAAGAYALAAAQAGMVGFATTNADSIVALFGSSAPFHGTNPLAVAAPNGRGKPWLLDMATSSIPLNRVLLYRSLGVGLPEAVAADATGVPTRDANAAAMLLPVGGTDFGFKGAALAGVATLLSAVLQGMALDHDMAPIVAAKAPNVPMGMGNFFLAIDPARFGGGAVFAAGMEAYLAALRAAPARPGATVMAPGDREWKVEAERLRDGIPLDPDTAAFLGLGAGVGSASAS